MDSNFYQSYFVLEENNWWFRVRRNLVFDLLRKYKITKGSKILDFGCGSGFLVGELQKRGYDAFGVDSSEDAIKFRKGINNLSVKKGESLNFSDSSFDLVVALDVIEHIKHDDHAVKGIERILKPGGIIIITVPAYQWMWGVQDEIAKHFRRYTVSSFSQVIRAKSNLKFIRKTYFNTFLFPPIAVVRILSKWFNLKERESDFDINSRFLNSLFYFIFNLETYFLKFCSFPFGVSILLVLKKNDKSIQK